MENREADAHWPSPWYSEYVTADTGFQAHCYTGFKSVLLLEIIWPLFICIFSLSVYSMHLEALKILISLKLLTLESFQSHSYDCFVLLLEKGSDYAFYFNAGAHRECMHSSKSIYSFHGCMIWLDVLLFYFTTSTAATIGKAAGSVLRCKNENMTNHSGPLTLQFWRGTWLPLCMSMYLWLLLFIF